MHNISANSRQKVATLKVVKYNKFDTFVKIFLPQHNSYSGVYAHGAMTYIHLNISHIITKGRIAYR